jgi:hypothetical protein
LSASSQTRPVAADSSLIGSGIEPARLAARRCF